MDCYKFVCTFTCQYAFFCIYELGVPNHGEYLSLVEMTFLDFCIANPGNRTNCQTFSIYGFGEHVDSRKGQQLSALFGIGQNCKIA